MRRILFLCITCLLVTACTPEDWGEENGPFPMATSISQKRGVMHVTLENGRTCRAQIPEISEPGGKGQLGRCPEGYMWEIARNNDGLSRFLATFAVAITDIFGSHRPSIGAGKVTITTPDGAVTVFNVTQKDGVTEIALIEQRPAPRG